MMKLPIMLVAAIALSACGWTGPKTVEKKSAETFLCGAYGESRALTDEERALFGRVTDSLVGVVYTPRSVSTQVVAGTNYRFVCTAVTATLPPETYSAELVVFQPLPGQGDARISRITRLEN